MLKAIKIICFKIGVPVADIVLLPFTFIAVLWLRRVRKVGVSNMPLARKVFERLGTLPVTTQYYDPLITKKSLRHPLEQERDLPGIDFDVVSQHSLLEKFKYKDELKNFPLTGIPETGYFYKNETFGPGDAEILYCFIRYFKPANFIEIGGGLSTLMVCAAISANRRDDPDYSCRHICIEPYENEWLASLDVEIVRQRVEDLDISLFSSLGENDFLFIDSTHIIRPQGDVVVEYMEILPMIHSGVIVHVHDIFTPRDYPGRWIFDNMLLWNEQYLLEAFLTGNSKFQVLLSLNHLYHCHRKSLESVCPILSSEEGPEPGSFWMRKL